MFSLRRYWSYKATSVFTLHIIILFTVILPGCSIHNRLKANPIPAASHESSTADANLTLVTATSVMVNDLLSAIVQIMPPKVTTIQVSSSIDTTVYLLVANSFAQRGFGVQKVTTDQGPLLMSVVLESELPETGNTMSRLRIGLGETSISRSYEFIGDNAVQPNSPFKLYGSRATIDYASTLFGASQISGSQNISIEYAASVALNDPLPTISLIAPEVVQRASDQAVSYPEVTSFNSSKVEVNNLFYSDTTFGSILDGREKVERLVIIFPNDSIIMGDENKLLVRRFAERFKESDDVIGVIGCSNGPTSSELGNVGLALGRAARITEELLAQGVPRPNILDEGCWAPQSNYEGLPGRGVVVELWRSQI